MSRMDYSHKARQEKPAGMACPRCGCRRLKSRRTVRVGDRTRRVRICRGCGFQVHTEERIIPELVPPTTIPENGAEIGVTCDSLAVLDLVE